MDLAERLLWPCLAALLFWIISSVTQSWIDHRHKTAKHAKCMELIDYASQKNVPIIIQFV